MANAPLTEVQPGDLLAGKYRIERVLGRGGMGVVVSAVHEALDERVALKFLLPEALANQEAVQRFLREARAAVKIRSEHVARVTDVGTLESGAPYMVMEYLDGVDLARYLESRGPLPVPEAVEYMLQACEALAEAHALGIVHRDLKPANLFRIERVDGTPSIKLLDFGISKVIAHQVALTQTSSMLGSPLYMAPEQMTSSKHVDARADVWALGIILFELVTGEPPFQGETLPEVCAQILTTEPRPIRALRGDVPPELESVVARCLHKEREQRYGSVAELAVALGPFAPQRALVSVERVSRVLNRQGAEPSEPPAPARTGAETQAAWSETAVPLTIPKRSTPWLAVAAAGLLVVGGSTVLLLSRSEPDAAVAARPEEGSQPVPQRTSPVPAEPSAPDAAPAPATVRPAPTDRASLDGASSDRAPSDTEATSEPSPSSSPPSSSPPSSSPPSPSSSSPPTSARTPSSPSTPATPSTPAATRPSAPPKATPKPTQSPPPDFYSDRK
ncbi:MAG: protein kinase [Myxococcales bacterium]|nr:protein kinase [Myxococcales bacterium]